MIGDALKMLTMGKGVIREHGSTGSADGIVSTGWTW